MDITTKVPSLFSVNRILLITAAHVGNVLFCTPAIHFLKKHLPQISMDVVVLHQRAADIFAHSSVINRVYVKTTRSGLQRLMKKYPLSICLNYVTTEKYLANYSGNLLSVPPSDPGWHRAEEVIAYIQTLVNQPVLAEDRRYWLYPQLADFAKVKKILPQDKDKMFVGIHLGSSRTQIHGWKFWYKKRTQDPRLWPLESYLALAEKLRQANSQIHFVLTGDKNEHFLGKVFAGKNPATTNLMGKTSLGELAALMSYLRVYVTHDTGVLHVACATSVPVVSLFGHTDPMRTGPYPVLPQRMTLQAESVAAVSPADVAEGVLKTLSTRP